MLSGGTVSISYGLIFLGATLEFLGLPFPGGILVAVAGATLARGSLRLVPLICVAAVGAVAGETPWYFLGRLGSNRLLHLYCRFTLGSRTCVTHTESFFRRFGILSLVFSKFFSGVRLFAPPMAGLAGYSFRSFLVLDFVGGVLWAGSFALSGKILGPRLPVVMSGQTVWVLTLGPLLLFFLIRVVKRMMKGSAEGILQSRSDGFSNAQGPN